MPDSAAATKATREQLVEWEKTYSTGWRQLLRYIAEGKAAEDPCPLNDPSAMPAWWARRKPHRRVPSKIVLAAERASRSPGSGAPPTDPQPGGESPPQNATSIDLAQFQLDEGEAVTLQRQIVGALHEQLREAYAKGWPTDSLQSRFNKAAANLRVLEKDDREAGVHRGKYIPRAEYERDASQLAAMLKQMRESMVRRVQEECPQLSPDDREAVGTAIAKVRAQEDSILERLQHKTPDDLLAELAA